MTKEKQELLDQARGQIELVKQQDRLLEDIEIHLHSMKRIAEYTTR